MTIRRYESADRDELWALKRAFELELGGETGGREKRRKYEGKLTEDYRERYLGWVERCVTADDRAVMVADAGTLIGYVFVLPEDFAMIWDAAVLNELFVTPDARGSGIADELLDAALACAADQSLPLERLLLDVDPGNQRAYAFYTRHGFEPWGEVIARDL